MLILPVWRFWKIGGQKFYCAIYNAKTRFLVGMWEFWLKYLILGLKKFPLNSHYSHWIVKILFSSLFLNVKYCVNLVGTVGICLKSNWYRLKMAVFCPKKRENSHSIPTGGIFVGSSPLDDALFLRVACDFGLYGLCNFIA